MTGRPSKLTGDVHRKLVAALQVGLSRPAASALAGIGERTLREWMARGEAAGDDPAHPDAPFAELRTAVVEAEGLCAGRLVGVVFRAAMKGDEKSAQWLLERRFPVDWARRTIQAHDVRVGEGVAVSLPFNPAEYTDEQLQRIAAGEPLDVVGAGGRS